MLNQTFRTRWALPLVKPTPLLVACACGSNLASDTSSSSATSAATATSGHTPLASFTCPTSSAVSSVLGVPLGKPSLDGGTVGGFTDFTCDYSVGVELEVASTRLSVSQFQAAEPNVVPGSNGIPISPVPDLGQAAYVWTSSDVSANEGLPIISKVTAIDNGVTVGA